MEMELDGSIKDPLYQKRFVEYLEYFEKHRVLETSPIAHYDDRGTVYQMSVSSNDTLKVLYEKYMDVVIKRQIQADKLFKDMFK
jgi:hypothetical protein